MWPLISFGLALKICHNYPAILLISLLTLIFFIVCARQIRLKIAIAALFFSGGIIEGTLAFCTTKPFKTFQNTEILLETVAVSQKDDENHTTFGKAKIVKCSQNDDISRDTISYFILKNPSNVDIVIGEQFWAKAKIEYVGRNSQKSFLKFLNHSNINVYIYNGKILKTGEKRNKFQQIFSNLNKNLTDCLQVGAKNSHATEVSVLIGMLTGNKTFMSQSQKQLFTYNGVAHIFAVSGLHVGIIALVINFFCKLLHIPKKTRCLPVISILLLYINVIGCPASAIRALFMCIFYYIAILTNRKPNIFAALVDSALLWLILRPQNIYDIGFLMSHIIVAGLIVIAPIFNKTFDGIRKRKLKIQAKNNNPLNSYLKIVLISLIYAITSSAAAELVTIPLSVDYFGQISKFSILVNAIAIPLATYAIICGALAVFACAINIKFLAILFNKLALFIIYLLESFLGLSKHGAFFCENSLQDFGLPISVSIILVFYTIGQKQFQNHAKISSSGTKSKQ